WLQRIDVSCERIQLFVAVASDTLGRRHLLESSSISRYEACVAGQTVGSRVHRRISHQIGNRPVTVETGVIEVAPVLHADQIGHLDGRKRTAPLPEKHPGRQAL